MHATDQPELMLPEYKYAVTPGQRTLTPFDPRGGIGLAVTLSASRRTG
jgi:hypothetical protein